EEFEAEALAAIAEREAPRERADERVRVKLQAVHLRDAGRKGDEGAYDREHPREQDDDLAAPREPAIAERKFVLRDEQVATVSFDGRPSAFRADPVRALAAEVAAERPGNRCEDQVEGGDLDAVEILERRRHRRMRHGARVRHDELTGERDACALDAHQEGDSEIRERGHHMDAEPAQGADDLLNHSGGDYLLARARSSNGPATRPRAAVFTVLFTLRARCGYP